MAVSGGFGMPAVKAVTEASQPYDSSEIRLLLLSVLTSRGSFQNVTPLAVGVSQNALNDYLNQWLNSGTNRQVYIRASITPLPFVDK